MREIKFRAKSLCKGEDWVYGDLRHYNRNPQTEKWTIHDPETGIETDIEPSTVGQYTWLKEKNGNDIYEGDIVSVAEYDNMLMHEFTEDGSRFEIFDIEEAKGDLIRSYTTAISWEDGAFVFSSNGEYNDTLLACLFGNMRRSCPIFEIEIVGNIHETQN